MISIIIPNSNGQSHLEKLLPTIAAQTTADFEVIVVDNASSDSSVKSVRALLPDARIIELEKNIGFAGACNRGAEAAGFDTLFFLNTDTTLDRRCLALCSHAIEEHFQAGFFQPKIVLMGSHDELDGAGDLLPRDGRPTRRARGMHSATPLVEQIISPCGAASLWRKDVFEKLGGFEESFFAYLEDIDLGLRALLIGIEGRYIPDAVVHHLGGGSVEDGYASSAFDRPEAVRWIARNKIWLWARCLPASVLITHAPWMIAGLAKSAAHHTLRSGAGAAFWKGTLEGLAGLPKVLNSRGLIQSERTITPGEFSRWMKRTWQWW